MKYSMAERQDRIAGHNTNILRITVLCACVLLSGCAANRAPISSPMPSVAVKPGMPAEPSAIPSAVPMPSVTQSETTVPAFPALPTPAPSSPSKPLPDKGALLQGWVDQQGRLYRVAAPLLINNVPLCPGHSRKLLGFTAKTRFSFTEQYAEAAQSALHLGDRLQVMSVLPGSGAAVAGLKKGDNLRAIEIEPLPEGPDAEKKGALIIGAELQGRDRVMLAVLRNEERVTLDIPLTSACAMVIELGNTDQVGSFADGQRIMITRGMLERLASDEELAYVLAREIAHNILMPAPRPEVAALIESLHTITSFNPAALPVPDTALTPLDMQIRADRLSVYLLARAGYALDKMLVFWKRLIGNDLSGNTLNQARFSADAEKRLASLAGTIALVRKKQQQGEPLVPGQQ